MSIDFNNTNDPTLTLEKLLRYTSQESIYSYYFPGRFYIGLHKSPFRKDKKASFSIYVRRNKIFFKDLSTGERGDCVDLVMLVCSLDHRQALFKIYNDLVRGGANNNEKRITLTTDTIDLSQDTKPIIKVVTRAIEIQDEIYWRRLNINKSIRDLYNAGVADKVFLNEKLIWSYKPSDPIYYYHFPGTDHFKIYRPLRKFNKWLSNVDNNLDIQGYHQCDIKNKKIKLLILTKSLKDVMFLRSLGLDAMAVHGENHIFNEDFIRHLKKYCDNIISLYDNDAPGVLAAFKLWRVYKIPGWFIPRRYKQKDITDLWLSNKLLTLEFIRKIKLAYGIYT